MILSHVLMLVLGFVLMRGAAEDADEQALSEIGRSELFNGERSTGIAVSGGASVTNVQNRKNSMSEMRRVWRSLVDQGLTRRERVLAQRRILEEWAKVDLLAAMNAILGESWKDEEGMGSVGAYEGALAPALAKAFAEDPEESWQLIHSGEFGLGAGMFRRVWFRALAESDPELLATMAGNVSQFDREALFTALGNGVLEKDILKGKVVDALKGQPEEVVSAQELLDFIGEEISHEDLIARLEWADFSTREGAMARLQYANSFREIFVDVKDVEQARKDLVQSLEWLPKKQRGDFVFEVAKEYRYREEGSDGERKMLSLVDSLIAEESWENLSSRELKNQIDRFQDIPEIEFAKWAVYLPQREETENLFHAGIGRYVENNMEEAWGWIQDFDDSRFRDRALVVYATKASNQHRDREETWKAINLIEDPEMRDKALRWRPTWMKRIDDKLLKEDSELSNQAS